MDSNLLNKRPKRILWIDLEMTGLSPTQDLILEVAAIVTDWDFKEIAVYQGVVKSPGKKVIERMTANKLFWDANSDLKNNLISQNNNGKPLSKIQSELIKFIDDNFEPNTPVLLGGNSIHIDRQFIKYWWPKLDAKLHYRMLDVSAWKVVFHGKFGRKYASSDVHRALDDIRGSIAELQYYLKSVKK